MAAKSLVMRTPEDVLAYLPVVFGFHPSESVCIVGVSGAGMHARLDLPTTPEDREEGVRVLADAAARNGLRSVLLVTYSDEGVLVEAMGRELELAMLASGVAVLDHLWVSQGRYRHAGANGFEPVEGVPFDVSAHPLLAERVFAGSPVPVASREALVASLAGTPDPLEPMSAAVERLGRVAEMSTGLAAEARWMQGRVRRYVEDRERLDVADAARLLAGMMLARLRDVVLAEVDRERTAAALVDLMTDLTRRAQGPAVAPVASLLAFAAWQAGNGALAWCAVDKARAVEPTYSLAGLVAAALEGAVPPREWPGIEPGDLPVLGGDAETA